MAWLHQKNAARIFAPESNYAFSRTTPRKSGPCGAALSLAVAVTAGWQLRCEDMPDQLSTLYSGLLEGSYDCVDRVVLNAYFGMGQTGGGLRIWWRALYGSDADLADAGWSAPPWPSGGRRRD